MCKLSILVMIFLLNSISFAGISKKTCADFTGVYQSKLNHDCRGLTCIEISILEQKDCTFANVFRKKVVLNSEKLPAIDPDLFDLHPENSLLKNTILANGQWTQATNNSFFFGDITESEISNTRFTNYDVGLYQKSRLVNSKDQEFHIEKTPVEYGVCKNGECKPPQWSKWDIAETWKKYDQVPEAIFKSPSSSLINESVLLKFRQAGWVAHKKANIFYSCDGNRDNRYFNSRSIVGTDSRFEESNNWLVLNKQHNMSVLNSLDKSNSYMCKLKAEMPSVGLQLTGELVVYSLDECQIFKAPSCCSNVDDLICQ